MPDGARAHLAGIGRPHYPLKKSFSSLVSGFRSGYARGLSAGRSVPDAAPGQFRVVHVDAQGKAVYVGKPFSTGDCIKVTGSNSIDNITSSFFGPCGFLSG